MMMAALVSNRMVVLGVAAIAWRVIDLTARTLTIVLEKPQAGNCQM